MIEWDDMGRVRVMRLARGKGNALNTEFLKAISAALDELERSPARSAVITGKGSVFGAGVDLPELLAGGEAYVKEFMPWLIGTFEKLATFPKPLVAAVNGHAIAGGAILAFGCDQRILAKGRAKFGLSEVLVGVQFPAWAIEIARFVAPPPHFNTMVLTGRSFSPEEAHARGLVDELVDPENLMHRALEVAEEMGGILPETFRATKLAVRRPMIEAARAGTSADKDIIAYWSSPEVLAAIRAFAEKMIGGKG